MGYYSSFPSLPYHTEYVRAYHACTLARLIPPSSVFEGGCEKREEGGWNMDPKRAAPHWCSFGLTPANPEMRPLSLTALLRAESDAVPPAFRGLRGRT